MEKQINYNSRKLDNTKIWLLFLFLGLLLGARFFHFLFSDPMVFIRNPLSIFMIWQGGMSFFGALVGCFIAAYYYLKKIKLNWKKFADVIVIAATIALIFGRIANFINGELIGTPSNVSWCVIFPKIDYVCRHPYQIYASFSHVVLLGVLLFVNKIKNSKKLRNGLIFITFVIGYSVKIYY